MPYIPHTDDEVQQMLAEIGVSAIDDLFDEIPQDLRCGVLSGVPDGLSEMEVSQLMAARAQEDAGARCFIGAGAYDHHIPAAVWEVTTRGEFYSAYTPYQAEASQGTLQLLYEFQSMITALVAMDVSNASMYDGASALAEAVLMAVRAHRKSKSKRVLIPDSLHPVYRKVVQTIVKNQGIELVSVPVGKNSGRTSMDELAKYAGEDITALVIVQPNFFGVIEEVDELTNWAAENKALSIAVVNPVAMALLKPPGLWGKEGADIACGEGQPLGAPLASGGPYFGFLTCKQAFIRQLPGRIAGQTVDMDGKRGFTLTLQAREQHIRRSKATSNICTNQGLLVTAATIHMSIMGGEGLQKVASACHRNTSVLINRLTVIPGVEQVYNSPFFNEVVIRLPVSVKEVLREMANHNILAGFPLEKDYPELENCLLVCATEKRTSTDIDSYVDNFERIINQLAA